MKISIGNKNKISNSVIGEQTNLNKETKKETFVQKYPVIISIVISFIVGFFLMFSFWHDVIQFIEDLLK